jgi:hypothetical protein
MVDPVVDCEAEYLSGEYQGGKSRSQCDLPTCSNFKTELIDAWEYPIGKKHGRLYYGYSIKVTIPETEFDENGWSMLTRVQGRRANIASWNSWIGNVFWHDNSTEVLLHQKDDTTDTDRKGATSFNVVFDWLEYEQMPQLFYWSARQNKVKCFYHTAATGYSEAVLRRSSLKSYKDVNVVIRTPKGKFHAKV